MPGDSHPRSAHRASPAGGLALLTPQALVRQAQAGQARARRAIIRQAVARQAAKLQAAQSRAGHVHPEHVQAGHAQARHLQARHLQAGHLQAGHARAGHLQAGRSRAARFRAASRPAWGHVVPDRLAAPQHRQPRVGRRPAASGRRWPRTPQQAPQSLMRGLGALIIMAIVGLSAFFIVAEERRGDGRDSAAAPGAEPGIASREVDAEPLTQREVFPKPTVQPAADTAAYQVTMTHSDSECRIATTGELGTLLEDHGCDQVVRARLTAPHGGYQVTAGIFNLADETGAGQVSELAGTLVETGRGTFTTLGGSAGDPLTEPMAQVGWRSRGHFLLYCVVARPDGRLVTDDDPYAARITAELVENYLGERVVGQRAPAP